jgi:large repetitive protein
LYSRIKIIIIMMSFVYRIFLLVCIASLWFSLSSYEAGAAVSRRSATGASFGNGNCGNCHMGGSYGTVNVTIQDFEVGTTTAVTAYKAGKTYDAKLSISSTTAAPFYGFQMVSVNAANAQAGTWSGFPTNVKGTLLAARTYVEQSVKLTANSYKITWTAPAAGTGAVKFYACGNALDGSGDESGDNAGVANITLNESVVAACTSATVSTTATNAACANSATGTATVTPTGGAAPYTYLWSNGATTQTVGNLLAGSYTVTVTEGGGCKTPSNAVVVGTNTLMATLTPSGSTTLCGGGSVNLTASGGTSYLWSTGATTATLANITTAGTYSVTVTNGACSATASQVVTVTQPPTASIATSGSTTLCGGGSMTLTASGGTAYLWSTGATTAILSNITAAGTYTVTVTNGGCSATASKVISAGTVGTATITPSGSTALCAGSSVNLTASGGTSYRWSTGATTATLSNITTAGTYSVTVTNGTCTATASQVVTLSNTGTATITPSGSTNLCAGGSVNLTASGGTAYRWSTGGTTATLPNITTAGTYSVTVTNGTCTASATQVVTMNPMPTAAINASGSVLFCQGGNVSLTASGGSTYLWATGGTTATLPNITNSGTYSVTVSNGACTATSSKVVTVLAAPMASIAASNPLLCQGSSVNLTASGGAFYTWSNGSSLATLNVTTAGTYAVTVSNGSCTSTASKTLVVSPSPTASIAASGATTFCQGGNVTLTASGGTTYLWSNSATTAGTLVSTAGTYTVSVTNNGCTGTTTKAITTIPAPSVRLNSTAANGTGGTATAIATGGQPPYIYDWSNNATNYTLIGLSAGTYFVTVTDANGCKAEGSVEVAVRTSNHDLTGNLPLTISPIPNDGHFLLSLELPSEQTINVEIYNMVGQKVDKTTLYGKSIAARINVSHLAMGQYLVKVNTESGVSTKWMMISK